MDGKPVARLSALSAPETVSHVAAELDSALAAAALDQRGSGETDLSLSADRQVDAETLRRLLQIARGAGVRRVEVLLTRGASPGLLRGPPEVDVVMPHDFVALPATLADAGVPLASGERFGDVAPALVSRVIAGEPAVALAVPGERR